MTGSFRNKMWGACPIRRLSSAGDGKDRASQHHCSGDPGGTDHQSLGGGMLERGEGWRDGWGRRVRGRGGQSPWGGPLGISDGPGDSPSCLSSPTQAGWGLSTKTLAGAGLLPRGTQQGDGLRHRVLQKSRASGTLQDSCCSC